MSNNVQIVTATQDCVHHVLFEPGKLGLRKSFDRSADRRSAGRVRAEAGFCPPRDNQSEIGAHACVG